MVNCIDCDVKLSSPNNWYPSYREKNFFVCLSCAKARANGYYNKDKERRAKINKLYGHNLKIEVLTHYGNSKLACVCCGETELSFLTIDHINNDGAEYRKLVGKAGKMFYLWLKQNNYPKGVQTLCWNCQWGKRLCGTCPHKKVKSNANS